MPSACGFRRCRIGASSTVHFMTKAPVRSLTHVQVSAIRAHLLPRKPRGRACRAGCRCCRWIRACAPPQARPSGSGSGRPGGFDRRPGRDDQPGAGDGRRRWSPGRACQRGWSCRNDDLAGGAPSLGKTPSPPAAGVPGRPGGLWSRRGSRRCPAAPPPVTWPAADRRPRHTCGETARPPCGWRRQGSGTRRRASGPDPTVAERRAGRSPPSGSGRGGPAGVAEQAAQLVAAGDPEFGVDVAQVVFDGLGGDEQFGGDLGVGHALFD
jgi:hypothetical protein